MTAPAAPKPVRLICGIIATDTDHLNQARERLEAELGAIDSESPLYPFDLTDHYKAEMGPNLVRQFFSFKSRIDPGSIPDIKLTTNRIESDLATHDPAGSQRTVNLDPGYITPAKLVLASAKNHSHRIYLRDGIYAEITLNFNKQGCMSSDRTFQDFSSGRYDEFFLALRREVINGG